MSNEPPPLPPRPPGSRSGSGAGSGAGSTSGPGSPEGSDPGPDPDRFEGLEEYVFELPEGLEQVPFAPDGSAVPEEHVSFEEAWASFGHPEDDEHLRLKELFHEWLGQNGYDVHRRDEPTIVGDLERWGALFKRYLAKRKLR